MSDGSMTPFSLDESFLQTMSQKLEPWAADPATGKSENVVAASVYHRTYSRNGERWYECIKRVVEGTFRIQERHHKQTGTPFDAEKAQGRAQEMYRRMFSTKILPPGRGLWAMGTPIVEKKGLNAALFNCGFISTKGMKEDPAGPFTFLMDASMLGIGVGMDLLGAGECHVHAPINKNCDDNIFVVGDSRESWVESVQTLLESYLLPDKSAVAFDYSKIRPKGTILKTFGGVSGGPEPLVKLHASIRKVLDDAIGSPLGTREMGDIANLIGVAVVSGNIRRTAEILFGKFDDEVFRNLKNYEMHPERAGHGWTSNNSIFGELGMDYSKVADGIRRNGEPGVVWMENMKVYSRMREDERHHKDRDAAGSNPCVEITLHDGELCNLGEIFISHHESLEDFLVSVELITEYVKTVTLLGTHWPKTTKIMLANRRMGVSISGVQNFLVDRSLDTLRVWLNKGYNKVCEQDRILSSKSRFDVPEAIKKTAVKPSGSVSLLACVAPGVHFPVERYCIRRITISKLSPLVQKFRDSGYLVEDSAYDTESVVVEMPMSYGDKIRCAREVSMWEQLAMAAFLQEHWSDNQVSATITYDPETEGHQIERALDQYQYKLKGISFLANSKPSNVYRVNGKISETIASHLRLLASKVTKCDTGDPDVELTEITFDSSRCTETLVTSIMDDIRKQNCIVESCISTPYPQMPFEACTAETYHEAMKRAKPVQWYTHEDQKGTVSNDEDVPSSLKFCDGDKCVV